MHIALTLLALGIVPSILSATPSAAHISKVRASGSGCPEPSSFIDVSPDRQVFTAVFSRFQAVVDSNSLSTTYEDREKRCNLTVKVHVPQGWQFAVFQADYEGWYDLQARMTMVLAAKHHFQGARWHRQKSYIRSRHEPLSGNFAFVHKVKPPEEWSACGGRHRLYLTFKMKIKSHDPLASGASGIDAIEGQGHFKARFGLKWRHCH